MFRKKWCLRAVLVLAIAAAAPLTAVAHESTTAGDYTIEYGWLNEPVVVGQPNALILFFSGGEEHAEAGGADTQGSPDEGSGFEVDVSNLKVEVSYGGETKTLALQPLGENTPAQFVAPILPTRIGQYALRVTGKISGSLGEADVNMDVEPEEVESADAVQFPRVTAPASNDLGLTGWLAVGGLLSGLVGLGVAVAALTRKK